MTCNGFGGTMVYGKQSVALQKGWEMDMKIFAFPNGDEVHRFDYNIVLELRGKRRVLSTAPYNGGYHTDLTTILNHDGNPGAGCSAEMKGDTYREHMMNTIREIGLDLETTTGMETAVHMETAAIRTETYQHLSATAIVTGGVEVNGGRVGDPATWVEDGRVAPEYRLGTINILLCVNVDLSEGAMARALVTCTEAKTAALGELVAESHYSRGLATGSGTDGTAIIADMESEYYLTDTGKHSKIGELIGRAVKGAVKEALYRQSGMGPEKQHDVFRRMSRFGLTRAGIYGKCKEIYGETAPGRPEFEAAAEVLAKESKWVINASFLAHAIDQMDWGLLSAEETLAAADEILAALDAKQTEKTETEGAAGTAGVVEATESAKTAESETEVALKDQAVERIMETFEAELIKQIVKRCETWD